MKGTLTVFAVVLGGIFSFAGAARAGGAPADQSIESELETLEAQGLESASVARKTSTPKTIEQIVCIKAGSSLSVRSENLRRVLFTVDAGAAIKVFQGWGDSRPVKVIRGRSYTFVKIQVTENGKTGWVATNFIQERSKCGGSTPGAGNKDDQADGDHVPPKKDDVKKDDDAKDDGAKGDDAKDEDKGPVKKPARGGAIAGLADSLCCEFPLNNRPTESFLTGMRRFGANRGGGSRTHAAADLYRRRGDDLVAVANGTVIRSLYYFYQSTYALEVKHQGGFVVRYGETTGKVPRGISGGKKVTMGDTVAYMGKTDCCTPMLHFELYSGGAKGSLNGGGAYRRRSDLMNPSKYLTKWEDKKFSPMK